MICMARPVSGAESDPGRETASAKPLREKQAEGVRRKKEGQ